MQFSNKKMSDEILPRQRKLKNMEYAKLSYMYLPKRVTFVVMEPALHTHDRHTIKITEDKLSDVTLYSGDWEVRNLFVGKILFLRE